MLSLLTDYSETEQYGLTVTIGDKVHIIICDDPNLTPNEKKIILQHERAHANGIDDEEDADKWALKHLNKVQQELLIANWKDRHGHDYNE